MHIYSIYRAVLHFVLWVNEIRVFLKRSYSESVKKPPIKMSIGIPTPENHTKGVTTQGWTMV